MRKAGSTPSLAAARNAAERSLRAGRFDEVETLPPPFRRTRSWRCFGRRRSSRRASTRKPEPLLQPFATAKPTGDAALETRSPAAVPRPPRERRGARCSCCCSRVELRRRRATTRARRGRRARSAGSRTRTRCIAKRPLAPNDAAIKTRVGRSVPRETQPAGGREVVPGRAQGRSGLPAGSPRHGAAVADDNPPAAMKYVQRALELNPYDAAAHLFLAELAIDDDKKNDARAAIAKAQAINPNSLEAHALQRGRRLRRRQGRRIQAAVAAALKINPLYGEAYRVVGSGHRALLPLRRSGRAGAARHRHRSRQRAGAGRSRRRI